MSINRSQLRNIILAEMKSLLGGFEGKLPDFLYHPLEDEISKSKFWTYPNTEDDYEFSSTPGGWQMQSDAAMVLQDAIHNFLLKNKVKVDITIISAEIGSSPTISLPVKPGHKLYPNKLVVGGQQAVEKTGRFSMYLFMVPVSEDFNSKDVNASAASRIVGNIIRHEIIHAIQMEKRRKNQKISRLDAKDRYEKSGEIPDSSDRAAYLGSKIEIDAYSHELAEELLQKYGKDKSLDILRGKISLSDLDLSDQLEEYLNDVPGKEASYRLKKKMYSHIIDLTSREIYSEAGKKKKKKKIKYAGSQPEDTYQKANKKNLYLDRPTSHGGWPEGPSKSFTSNKPVNVQISSWLKSMGMMEEDINK